MSISKSTDHRPFSAQFLEGLGGLLARLTKGKLFPLGVRWFWEEEVVDDEHGEIPDSGDVILGPLEVELASGLVGDEGVAADGFLG